LTFSRFCESPGEILKYTDLLSERSVYMTKCKKIREIMAGDYDTAADQGVSKKLLKKIIKERALELSGPRHR